MVYSVMIKSESDLQDCFRSTSVLEDSINCLLNQDSYYIVTKPGDTLFGLFGLNWQKVYRDQCNEGLREACPDVNTLVVGVKIFASIESVDPVHTSRLVKVNVLNTLRYPVIFRSLDQYTGDPARIISFKSELKCRRHQFVHLFKGSLFSAHDIIAEKLKEAEWSNDFVFFTETELQNPQFARSFESLFHAVNKGQGCYWIAVEPFNFFMDIDFYDAPYSKWNNMTLRQIADIVSKQCKHWLITETSLGNGMPSFYSYDDRLKFRGASYNVFTDRLVTTPESVKLEQQMKHDFAECMDEHETTPIGSICGYFQPFIYRRAPYSLQKWWRHEDNPLQKKSVPKLEYSNLPSTDPLEIFRFSYPLPE